MVENLSELVAMKGNYFSRGTIEKDGEDVVREQNNTMIRLLMKFTGDLDQRSHG